MLSLDPTRPSIYSPALQKWLHHARDPDHDLKLRPITPITTAVQSTLSRAPPKSLRPFRERKWWSRCVTQDAPEMGAALGFIDEFLEESHVVSTHAELLDPGVGSLLAFGKAVDESKSTRLIDTAVYAMGTIGADLGAGVVVEGYRGLEGVKGVGVGLIRIEGAGQVAEFGSRIKQVCVAGKKGGEGSKPNVAIRTAVGTTILRQNRLNIPLAGRSTRLTANRLVNIDVSGTGKAAHAHVDFNPWYERQFAVIDESGKWGVYDIEGRQHRDLRIRVDLNVEKYANGSIASEDGTGGGWGRIVWGGDLNSVLACDRKRAGLFDIRSSPSTRSEITIPVDQAVDQGWILDLQRGPSLENYAYDAFILTAAGLTWVDMRQSGKPLMNIPHHRHHKDTSLSMELFNINDSTINALIYSRLNHLITSYRFSLNETEQFPTFLGNPSLISGPTPHNVETPVSFGLNILPCPLKQHGETDEKGEEYLADEDLRFFTGFGVNAELGITQRMYCNKEGNFRLVKKKGKDHVRMWEATKTHSATGAEDEYETSSPSASDSDSSDSAVAVRPTKSKTNIKSEVSKKPRRVRADLNLLYTHAFNQVAPCLRTATEDDPKNSITASTAHIKDLLTIRLARGDLGIISLLNLRQPELLYDRLEDFQASIQSLLLADESLREYQIKSLIPSNSNNEFLITQDSVEDPVDLVTTFPVQLSILPLYRTLVRTWVNSLPEKTPGKIRLHRERICRMIATEIWLSSIGVNLEPKLESLPPLLPPSQDTGASTPPIPLEPEPLIRIRTYANVSTRVVLPEGMSSVLSKWDIGEDPWEYEYIPGEQSGIRKKKRQHRRKNSAKKGDAVNKLRGDVENWSLGMNPQPPAITVASQPVRPVVGSSQVQVQVRGSSQVAGSSQIVSQVERGKLGGRVAVRKKRKTGF